MSNDTNDFGPWLEPLLPVGFCPFCREEKSDTEVGMIVPHDMLTQTKKACEMTDDSNLPLVLCKVCKSKLDRKMRSIHEALERMGFKQSYE